MRYRITNSLLDNDPAGLKLYYFKNAVYFTVLVDNMLACWTARLSPISPEKVYLNNLNPGGRFLWILIQTEGQIAAF